MTATVSSFPNAGEFFNLPLAIILSVVLAILLGTVLFARNRSYAGIAFIFSAAFGYAWFMTGLGQLLNCVE